MRLESILKLTQEELFKRLLDIYKDKAIYQEGSYVLVKGKAPIMLIAHMDTVHTEPVKDICKTGDGDILMSPQGIGGDDRCGIYALITIYRKSKVKPWLLFTCDEETGGVGAYQFCEDYSANFLPKELSELKCLIEIDRKGSEDAVYYDCCNYDFEDYITTKGFKTDYGTFSDICYIAPELEVAAVNLSSGYYNAHTLYEYINRSELNETIRKVIEIVAESVSDDFPVYEYGDVYSVWYGYDYNLDRSAEDQIMYNSLLTFYTAGEIDQMIADYGEQAIALMYESEFGRVIKPYEYYENNSEDNDQ